MFILPIQPTLAATHTITKMDSITSHLLPSPQQSNAENIVPDTYSTPSIPSNFKLKKFTSSSDDEVSPMSSIAETPVERLPPKKKSSGRPRKPAVTFASELDQEAQESDSSDSSDESSSEEEEEDDHDEKSVGSFASVSSAASSASARVRLMLNSALPTNMSRNDAEKKLRSESEFKTPRGDVPVKPHQKSREATAWRKGRNMGIGLGYKEPAVGGGAKDER